MSKNKTIKKNYIRPKLHKSRSKIRSRPKLYKSKSRTRSNNKNKNISRSRSNSRLSKYDYGFSFRGGKKFKGGMDKEPDGSVFRFPKKTETQKVFEEDNKTGNLKRPGNWYGIKYKAQYCSHMFNPEPENSKFFGKYSEVSEKLEAKKNRKFFSPYTRVCIGNWRGWTNHYANSFDPDPDRGNVSDKSKTLVENIKKLDMDIDKLLSSIITNTETVNNENLSKAINLINEKNENITDLQIHRLDEGFGNYGHTTHPESFMLQRFSEGEYKHNADYILHRYVIQCIIRLRCPRYTYAVDYGEEIDEKDFEISKQEKDALKSIKNEKTDTYNEEAKIELFGKIKDMPIIPIEFSWLLDKRIVKEKKYYKLFGSHGIFRILLPNKEEWKGSKHIIHEELDFDLSRDTPFNRYMSITAYTVFLKIWTANVIAKYIFKIYHDTSFTYIKGDTYPTIGECMSKMDITEDYNLKEEQLKIIKEDAKQRIILEADEPNVTSEIQEESPLSQKPYGVNIQEGAVTDPFKITDEDPFSEKPKEEPKEEPPREKPQRNEYKGEGNSLRYIVDPKEYDGEKPYGYDPRLQSYSFTS